MLSSAAAARLAAGDERIVITGASGWLGLATIDLLRDALGSRFDNRVALFGSSARPLILRDGDTVQQHPLQDLPRLPERPTWLLHFAFLTKDRAETLSEEAYRAANRLISDTVSGALDRIGTTALFLASSGAAQKADDHSASPAMRLYGSMKRDDEALFAHWAEAADRRAVIGRIFNIAGPYINKHQAYALASFILDAQAGHPVRVTAPRPVIRSYVAIRELVSLCVQLLATDGAEVVRFDSGGEELELGDVAAIVADVLGAPGVERAPITVPEADRYVGDVARYAALLRTHQVDPVPFHEQVLETASFLSGLR
jgi:nucleoside-diphosphate-sugar epimerase